MRWALLAAIFIGPWAGLGQALPSENADESVRNEIEIALDHGLSWLATHQNPDGSWSDRKHLTPTALAMTAFLRAPNGKYMKNPQPEFLEKAADILRKARRKDGSFGEPSQDQDETSVCLPALIFNGAAADEKRTRLACSYLTRRLAALHNGKKTRWNLSDLTAALEALRVWSAAHPNDQRNSAATPNEAQVVSFLNRCQSFAKDAGDNRGGFVEAPAQAGKSLPSGAATFSGLLGLIYTGPKGVDGRVEAALSWIGKHHTLEENPGAGQTEYYRYLLLMAKGLTAAGVTDLQLDGRKINWARVEALKLLDLQNSDGSWINSAAKENDPVVATSRATLTLEILYYRM
jgi:squalene-hopene/tetraprenyl-beta-curcumene cyclase